MGRKWLAKRNEKSCLSCCSRIGAEFLFPHCTILTGKSGWISIQAFVTSLYGILAFSRFRNPLTALIEELFA